jgi:major histocompatibility complex class I
MFGAENNKAYIAESVLIRGFELPGVVAHAFNSSTWVAEAVEFLSSRPAWSTE